MTDSAVRAPDVLLLKEMGPFLPCQAFPAGRLRRVDPDPAHAAAAAWEREAGVWRIRALQTTNDSQIGCVPWGRITAVSFSASRPDAGEAYRDWSQRLATAFGHEARATGAKQAYWLGYWDRHWWYARVDARAPQQIRLEFAAAAFDSEPFLGSEYATDDGKVGFFRGCFAGESGRRTRSSSER